MAACAFQERAASDPAELHSSLLSSPPSSAPSSPLSSPGCTPSPPPEISRRVAHLHAIPYPSPPASQRTSPPLDGMDSTSTTDKEGPPPAKRRRITKERTTEYLDLRSGDLDPRQQVHLDQLLGALHRRRKIVAVAGAGISVSAGIPDFRSANGLFRSLKDEHKLKGSGKDLFDASVYKDDSSTSSFHDMISSMSRLTKDARPTAFHHMLATIASEDRLLRLYSQNVDGIDTALRPLETSVPLRKDDGGKWPRTVQLHGGLDKMVCSKCHELSDLNADLFSGPIPPACPNCVEFNSIRVNHEGKRSHGIGRLRPRMVLYNEANPDDTAIGSVTSDDLRKRPDAVIVAGTTLKVPGVRRIVREMCKTVRDRRGGLAIWINTDLPPVAKELEDCFDIVVQGTCDEVAKRAAMRRWDEPVEQDVYSVVSEQDAKKANVRTAEVHLPMCTLPCAKPEAPPTDRHFNNSFTPPPPDSTPKKPTTSPPFSPMPNRESLPVPSIESDADSIAVMNSGTATPTKTQKNAPLRKPSSFGGKTKDAAKPILTSSKPSKTSTAKPKQKNVKYIKSSKPTTKAKAPTAAAPKANTLDNTFKAKKASAGDAQPAKKSVLSTPSKLKMSLNVSPSKTRPFFPNLSSGMTMQAVGEKTSSTLQDVE